MAYHGPTDPFWRAVVLLAVSGIAGAFARAVFAPEPNWRRQIAEVVAGILSAVFLGGFVSQVVGNMVGPSEWVDLASGFVMGYGGMAGVKQVQDRILTSKGKDQ